MAFKDEGEGGYNSLITPPPPISAPEYIYLHYQRWIQTLPREGVKSMAFKAEVELGGGLQPPYPPLSMQVVVDTHQTAEI